MLKELKLRELERKRDTMRHRLQMKEVVANRARGLEAIRRSQDLMLAQQRAYSGRIWNSHGWQP